MKPDAKFSLNIYEVALLILSAIAGLWFFASKFLNYQVDTPSSPAANFIVTPTLAAREIPYEEICASNLPTSTQLLEFWVVWQLIKNEYLYFDSKNIGGIVNYSEHYKNIQAGLNYEEYYQYMEAFIFQLNDKHSKFVRPPICNYSEVQGYLGIGVSVVGDSEDQRAVIVFVFSGSPAENAGLRPRDSILAVDGIPVVNEYGSVEPLWMGPKGTKITLLIQSPNGESRDVEVTRYRERPPFEPYPVPYLELQTSEGKSIGYIAIFAFQNEELPVQMEQALHSLSTEHPLDGLILDVRINRGGEVNLLVTALSFFIEGTLGYEKSRIDSTPLEISELNDAYGSSQLPLVVLISQNTISGGEFFAGLLREFHGAYLIGEPTSGNLERLKSYPMVDGSRLNLAFSLFYPIHNPDNAWLPIPIQPDLEVKAPFGDFTFENDPVIQAALDYFDN